MEPVQIVFCILFLAFSAGSFVISYLQFQEKGYLLNNAYLWAGPDERSRMDRNPIAKRPYYRQSGTAFLLIGTMCLTIAVYFATSWLWMLIAFILSCVLAVVYAVVSSLKLERRSSRERS